MVVALAFALQLGSSTRDASLEVGLLLRVLDLPHLLEDVQWALDRVPQGRRPHALLGATDPDMVEVKNRRVGAVEEARVLLVGIHGKANPWLLFLLVECDSLVVSIAPDGDGQHCPDHYGVLAPPLQDQLWDAPLDDEVARQAVDGGYILHAPRVLDNVHRVRGVLHGFAAPLLEWESELRCHLVRVDELGGVTKLLRRNTYHHEAVGIVIFLVEARILALDGNVEYLVRVLHLDARCRQVCHPGLDAFESPEPLFVVGLLGEGCVLQGNELPGCGTHSLSWPRSSSGAVSGNLLLGLLLPGEVDPQNTSTLGDVRHSMRYPCGEPGSRCSERASFGHRKTEIRMPIVPCITSGEWHLWG